MEVLILLVALSLALAGAAVGFYAWLVRKKNFEHDDRLVLLPLDEEK